MGQDIRKMFQEKPEQEEQKLQSGHQQRFEERLNKACEKPALKAISIAVSHLAESQKISCDQAAREIVESIKELEKIWSDYVTMEGINNLKSILSNQKH